MDSILYTTAVDECASKGPASRLLIITNEKERKEILDYRRQNGSKSHFYVRSRDYNVIAEQGYFLFT